MLYLYDFTHACTYMYMYIHVHVHTTSSTCINPCSLISYDTNLYDWLYLGNGDRVGYYLLAARGEYITLP